MIKQLTCALLGIITLNSYAATIEIPMYLTNKSRTPVGSITASDSTYGLIFIPHITNLENEIAAGVHGFHIHEAPSCDNNGMAAKGHLDPQKTNHHYGPYNANGHLGDLPALYVNANGTITLPVLAPRLKVKDILGHSLMIHSGSDNYADTPKPLGGGETRMVCGVIR
jgi:Cu-Zn family superoxide dismutase